MRRKPPYTFLDWVITHPQVCKSDTAPELLYNSYMYDIENEFGVKVFGNYVDGIMVE